MPFVNFLKTGKRYLSGIDWLVHALNYMTKKATGAGNSSQIILELEGKPGKELIRKCLVTIEKEYPVLSGLPARALNLAPYWKMPSSRQIRPLSFDIKRLQNGADINDVFLILEQFVNMPFTGKRDHLGFHLVEAGTKSYFAMTFDHRLLDGRGAEAFIGLMREKSNKSENVKFFFTAPSHLNAWRLKFKAGQNVNRAFLRLAKKGRPNIIPLSPGLKPRGFKFKLISFDKQQSRLIVKAANNLAGYLMLMPYLLTAGVRILHNIFTGRGMKTGNYVIPVAIDLRSPEKLNEEVFFNYMSFFMFQIDSEKADNFSFVLKSLKQQMYEQVKSGLPKDIQEASHLMRIVPLPFLSRLMGLHLKGRIASFCFSYVGETGYPFSEFMGSKVNNIFHMPRVPAPPGLGIFFHQFQGKLNGVLSYTDEILSPAEANTIMHLLGSLPEHKWTA